MRILVVGDRHWDCPEVAELIASRLLVRYGPAIVIIHGGEPGVDQAIAMACESHLIQHEARLPSWAQTGLPTIATKNRELIKAAPDLCVAVHQAINTSKRTRDCVLQAIQAGIPTYVVEDELAIPKRLRVGDNRLK